jgi:hypothetical protein
MSSNTSLMVQITTLLWLTTIIYPSRRPVFAVFMPLDQRLYSEQAHLLRHKRDFCVIPCGPYGQICCDLNQVCYTDSSGNGLCSETSALSAGTSTLTTDISSGGMKSPSSTSYTIITVTQSEERTSSVLATSSPTLLPTATSTQPPSDSTGTRMGGNGLSTGAKIGVAIGVVAAVVGVVFGIVLWGRRSRWKSSSAAGSPTRSRRRPDRTGIILPNYSQ